MTNFVLWNDDVRDHTFLNPYIYFSFSSNVGVNISVRVEFNDDKAGRKRKRDNSSIQEGLYVNDEELQPKATEDQFAIFAQKVLSKQQSPVVAKTKDFINNNIKMSTLWHNESKRRRMLNSQLTQIRIKSTKQKKERIVRSNLMKSQQYLNRWDVIKDTLMKNKIAEREKAKQTLFKDAWTRYAHLAVVLKCISHIYNVRRNQVLKEK